MLLMCGPVPPATIKEMPFEDAPPGPFCMVNTYVPAKSVSDPVMPVDVLFVKLELGRLQGVHPEPLTTTNTVLGSMPVPVMLKVND